MNSLHAAQAGLIPVSCLSSLYRILRRLHISWQRARDYLHSPDADYLPKLDEVRRCLLLGREAGIRVLFLDEFTYTNQPGLVSSFSRLRNQPLAHLPYRGKRSWRVVGALDPFTGELYYRQRSRINLATLVSFYQYLCDSCTEAQCIYLITDNWPVHYHPNVIEALQAQQTPFPLRIPQSWSHLQGSGKYRGLDLPIQYVPLPTYASWLNPIEKVWRKLKQELLHLHPWTDQFDQQKQKVEDWLASYSKPSNELLSYTGLLNPKGIFANELLASNGTVI